MLNKEFFMAVGEGLEPVLSIYITPESSSHAIVYVTLSSGDVITVTYHETERKTFKFSEIDVTARIEINYYEYLTNFTIRNLVDCDKQARKPEIGWRVLCIEDVTQSASILIE